MSTQDRTPRYGYQELRRMRSNLNANGFIHASEWLYPDWSIENLAKMQEEDFIVRVPTTFPKTTGPVDLPTPKPLTPPPDRYRQYTINLQSLMAGTEFVIYNYNGKDVRHDQVWLRLTTDGKLLITHKFDTILNINAPHTDIPEYEKKPLRHMHNVASRTERLMDDNISGVLFSMEQKARCRIRKDWNREIPDAVLRAALDIDFYGYEKLQCAGDHYYINHNGMYIGIEEDGYAHT